MEEAGVRFKQTVRESLAGKVTVEPRLEGGKVSKSKPPTDVPSRHLLAPWESRLVHKHYNSQSFLKPQTEGWWIFSGGND